MIRAGIGIGGKEATTGLGEETTTGTGGERGAGAGAERGERGLVIWGMADLGALCEVLYVHWLLRHLFICHRTYGAYSSVLSC